jgi:hypothetical protein
LLPFPFPGHNCIRTAGERQLRVKGPGFNRLEDTKSYSVDNPAIARLILPPALRIRKKSKTKLILSIYPAK